MHPVGVIEVSGVFIQLDGHSGTPLCSAIKQMSSAVKCVSLYCYRRGSPAIFDMSLLPALAAAATSETQKGNGETFWSHTQCNPAAAEWRELLVFSNEILSLEQHEGVWRAAAAHHLGSSAALRDSSAASAVCNSEQRLADCASNAWNQALGVSSSGCLKQPTLISSALLFFFDKFSWQQHQHVLTPLLTLIKVVSF